MGKPIYSVIASTGRDLTVAGPGLAAHAIRAGGGTSGTLFVAPVLVGGGTRALPDRARVALELVDQRRFGGDKVYLRYHTGT